MQQEIRLISLTFATQTRLQFLNITDAINRMLAEQGFLRGDLLIQSEHTTAKLWFNEDEPLMHEDMRRLIRRIVPEDTTCQHDDFTIRDPATMCDTGECDNGWSHLVASLFFEQSLNLLATGNGTEPGRLVTGDWGCVLLVELDRARPRRVTIRLDGVFQSSTESSG